MRNRRIVEAQKVGRTGDAAIAGQIVSNLNTGRTFAFVADQEKAILALTPAKVADAFRKHVDPKGWSSSARAISRSNHPVLPVYQGASTSARIQDMSFTSPIGPGPVLAARAVVSHERA